MLKLLPLVAAIIVGALGKHLTEHVNFNGNIKMDSPELAQLLNPSGFMSPMGSHDNGHKWSGDMLHSRPQASSENMEMNEVDSPVFEASTDENNNEEPKNKGKKIRKDVTVTVQGTTRVGEGKDAKVVEFNVRNNVHQTIDVKVKSAEEVKERNPYLHSRLFSPYGRHHPMALNFNKEEDQPKPFIHKPWMYGHGPFHHQMRNYAPRFHHGPWKNHEEISEHPHWRKFDQTGQWNKNAPINFRGTLDANINVDDSQEPEVEPMPTKPLRFYGMHDMPRTMEMRMANHHHHTHEACKGRDGNQQPTNDEGNTEEISEKKVLKLATLVDDKNAKTDDIGLLVQQEQDIDDPVDKS